MPGRARPQLEQDRLAKTLGPGRIWPRIAVAAASFAARPAAE